MRRKDREITDSARIGEIIAKCRICRIGFNDCGRVYIVPLNFGYTESGGERVFYFHSAKEGRKIDLAASSPEVGFELDTGYELWEGETACEFSAGYESIIGSGKVSIVGDPAEKEFALKRLMYQSTGREDWSFDEKELGSVCVIKLTVTELSAKAHCR